MCGIFGFSVEKNAKPDWQELHRAFNELVKLSESRGKEAAGLAALTDEDILIFKKNIRGSKLIKTKKYQEIFESPFHVLIGHTRLVTNGSMEDHVNNQPVVRNDLVGIHNGIIVNDARIFDKYNLERQTQVDTEALLALISRFGFNETGLKRAINEIEGEASVAILSARTPTLVLATNNGSLYLARYKCGLIFASERYILDHLPESLRVRDIKKLSPGTLKIFPLDGAEVKVRDIDPRPSFPKPNAEPLSEELIKKFSDLYEEDVNKISQLRRCSRCILPETMPFIQFDEAGVCNYCLNYQKKVLKNPAELEKIAAQIRNLGQDPDCIFPLSGGRDSSYGLHYVKKVLGLNPIAYSYDWGMLADLGRRNQARMSGQLGVEHLWLSADIIKKRKNIRKNVLAWLKSPRLGTVPLFMAGDKQYFYYLNKLREQLKLKYIFYCENHLEHTNFKYGFCGIPPKFGISHVYNLGIFRKLALAWYYFKEAMKNPAYLNFSLLDSVGAYLSTYFIPHDYIFLYDYIPWKENLIDQTLLGDYNWETSPDTPSTWRIGDGTAAFYNYIYYHAAGLTENDTFRSNQIREGEITRGEALKLVTQENKPRYESIKWYCDTIGIDFADTLEKVHSMPTLYEKTAQPR